MYFDSYNNLNKMTEELHYYDCPECRGTGQQMYVYYANGHREAMQDCEFCEGNGVFDSEEFLLLKLEGRV
jgi:DnaJ-class molecular chaperone